MAHVLGEKVSAPEQYSPEILEPIGRAAARERLGITDVSFIGADVWHLYELSWLEKGMPTAYCGALVIPAQSAATVESKSLKLYLNSLNFKDFEDKQCASKCIENDLERVCGDQVELKIVAPDTLAQWTRSAAGTCIDGSTDTPMASDGSGASTESVTAECLHSHLLRSLCPVTGQPDWATLEIDYAGQRIDREWLQQLVLSFRRHQDFHEQCIEQVFAAIVNEWQPQRLAVAGFYARRGGIDITPHRVTGEWRTNFERLARQ